MISVEIGKSYCLVTCQEEPEQVTMAVTREEGILAWAARWKTLKAWKRDLSGVTITVDDKIYADKIGTCYALKQHVVIHRASTFISSLTIVLHELAHAGTIGEHHNEPWQVMFAEAVTEVTGVAVVPVAYDYRVLNDACHEVMAGWWKRTGNDKIWRMASAGAV